MKLKIKNPKKIKLKLKKKYCNNVLNHHFLINKISHISKFLIKKMFKDMLK